MITEVVRARGAIEALRAGVPSRHAVGQLSTTQTEARERFEAALDAAADGGSVAPIVLSANFGAGKSHLLEFFQSLAERRHFVTALVTVSPEMPLGNAHLVLKTVAESARPPGRTGKALRELAVDLKPGSEGFRELERWATDADIRDRFRALLRLYETFGADSDLQSQILGDFEGKPLAKTVIKQKLKEIQRAAEFDLTGPRNALLAHDRIRLLARFFRACGCHGLVVLFDELERVNRFSTKQRVAAYQEIGWWRAAAAEAGSGIVPVFAMTTGFVTETITDPGKDRDRLMSSTMAFAQDDAERWTSEGLELLMQPPVRLETPTPEQEEEVKYRIKSIYEQAYGVSVPSLPAAADVRTSIRSEIRRWITQWDLHRYDPEYLSTMEASEMTFSQTEIADADLPPDEEEG